MPSPQRNPQAAPQVQIIEEDAIREPSWLQGVNVGRYVANGGSDILI